jgi:ADP-ribose pyrophosphatase YjhB (NUDIX family)
MLSNIWSKSLVMETRSFTTPVSAFILNMPISQYLKNLREKVGNEILQIPSAAAIIRDENGRVLLVKSGNVWGLPAGAIDLGESPEEAVVREVFEETNLNVRPVSIAGVFGGEDFRYVYANGDRVEYFIVVYECEITGGELSARDGEVSAFRYFVLEEMPELAIPYPKSILISNRS